jgi:transcriptional regulator with XRE-family HTH domain
MFSMQNVGKRINQLRKAANMTQMELADRLQISFQAVSNWERGESMPDISKLPELAEILNTTVDELLGGTRVAKIIESIIEDKENNDIVKIAERIIHRYIAKRRRLPDRRTGYTQKAKINGQSVYKEQVNTTMVSWEKYLLICTERELLSEAFLIVLQYRFLLVFSTEFHLKNLSMLLYLHVLNQAVW